MRQVPKYCVIGNGRLARHFIHYLTLLEIPYLQWSRDNDPTHQQLKQTVSQCDIVLLLISDGAIESFINDNSFLKDMHCVHCSGALVLKYAYGAHPLFSFANNLYDEKTYSEIPFIIEDHGPNFNELLPGLTNPSYAIPAEHKPLYHSLCVLSGNFSCILWQKMLSESKAKLNLPAKAIEPYMTSCINNLKNNPSQALTGPLARGDVKTIEANLEALNNDPYKKIYETFVELFAIKETA